MVDYCYKGGLIISLLRKINKKLFKKSGEYVTYPFLGFKISPRHWICDPIINGNLKILKVR